MAEQDLELRLFDDGEAKTLEMPVDSGERFVLSSNWSIGPLLARGCLLPPIWGEASDFSFINEGWPDTLPSSVDVLPAKWCNEIRTGQRNAFPIAVKLRSTVSAPLTFLSLDEVDCLVFENGEEQSMMSDTRFADLDLRGLRLRQVVDPTIFAGPEATSASTPRTTVASKHSLRTADSLAALRAVLPHIALGTEEWMDSLLSLWQSPHIGTEHRVDWISDCVAGVVAPAEVSLDLPLDRWLLRSFARLIFNDYDIGAGWPAAEILERLVDLAREDSTRAADLDTLSKWSESLFQAIHGSGDVLVLDDEKGVPYRAISYVLLRGGDVGALLKSDQDGPMKVGRNVRAVAASLAAIRTGLRALPNDTKVPSENAPALTWLGALGRSVLSDLGLIEADTSLSATLEENHQRSWQIRLGAADLFKVPVVVDASVDRVLQALERVGWPVDGIEEASVFTRITVSGGADFPVRIMSAVTDSAPPLSAVVTVRSLSASRSSSVEWPSKKASKLTKKVLSRILEMNGKDPTSTWRIALSEKESAVVLIDHLYASEPDSIATDLSRLRETAASIAAELFDN